MKTKMNFDFSGDVDTALSMKGIDIDSFCNLCSVPKRTIFYSFNNNCSNDVLERVYSSIYNMGIRLSVAKSELLEENVTNHDFILYHASKNGIDNLTCNGSRQDCDFGLGFYLTRLLPSAKSFIEATMHPSIYAFAFNLDNLNVLEFECDLSWMLAICFYRGKINEYKDSLIVKRIIEKIEKADLIVAPIADNKMFEIINKFANDDITTEEAIHALSASRLGKQYVIKTKKALENLVFKDRFYICSKEREESRISSIDRNNVIQTKIDYAKHKYRTEGKYISEILI